MHPVRVNTYNLIPGELRHLENGLERGTLSYLEMAEGRLAYAFEFSPEEHPTLKALEAHVLPELGLRVVRFEHREALPPGDYDYYVDIVSVTEQGERWVVRDLYLDVLVFNEVRAKILDTDEYLAARAEGHMDAHEADEALLKLHDFLDGLARYGYSLERYLETQGVSLTWRR
jgi:predicted RNA-binding protein associated with RNAse of E/G family